MKQYNVGIIGATGMVGQRFTTILENHPWFSVKVLAASSRSAGKTYKEAIGGRWKLSTPMPKALEDVVILDAEKDIEAIGEQVDFVFCAINLSKEETRALEEKYAKAEIPVVSNNSAHRHTPDVPMRDGDEVAGWTAIHTPGHASDHLCFARDGVVFTADHIMSWSTSVVSPPHGNMRAYFDSMRRMLARDDRVYLPGHGPMVDDPMPFARALLTHRAQREAAIAGALAAGPTTSMGLVDALYATVNPKLRPAAQRTVIAHLEKLREEGRAALDGEMWRAA